MTALARSFLYVPGTKPELMEKCSKYPADAVILDLEDAVHLDHKEQALTNVVSFLASSARAEHVQWWVRVDSTLLAKQLPVLLNETPPEGLIIPNCTVTLLQSIQNLHVPSEIPPIIALIETATGLHEIFSIAQHPLVSRLSLGEADLSADLGIDMSLAPQGLTPARFSLVHASAAAGLPGPVGPVQLNLTDAQALAETSRSLRAHGYRGRTALHPKQLDAINEAFSPSAAEIAQAQKVMAAFTAAQKTGDAVLVDENGFFLDEAVVRKSRELLQQDVVTDN